MNTNTHQFTRARFLQFTGACFGSSLLSQCASNNLVPINVDIPLREYPLWAKHKTGTTKWFSGTSQYGGKVFPIQLTQKLLSVDAQKALIRVTYYVNNLVGKTINRSIYKTERWYGGIGPTEVMAAINVPQLASTSRSQILYEKRRKGRNADVSYSRLLFKPRSRSFDVNNSHAILTDLYEDRSQFKDGESGSVIKSYQRAWFSDAVPGGWVAAERDSGVSHPDALQMEVNVNKKMFSESADISDMFYLSPYVFLKLDSYSIS